MNRTEKAQELILETKGALITELVDLVNATGIIAKELNVMRIYQTMTDGRTSIHFYGKFPFTGDKVKRRTIKYSDGSKTDELYTNLNNIEFSCFAPRMEE